MANFEDWGIGDKEYAERQRSVTYWEKSLFAVRGHPTFGTREKKGYREKVRATRKGDERPVGTNNTKDGLDRMDWVVPGSRLKPSTRQGEEALKSNALVFTIDKKKMRFGDGSAGQGKIQKKGITCRAQKRRVAGAQRLLDRTGASK